MKIILILLIVFSISLEAKYKSAEELSRKIPIISTPKLTHTSGIALTLGGTMNTTYTTDYQIGLNYNYMLSDSFGFVLDGYYALRTNSGLYNQLQEMFEKSSSAISLPNFSRNEATFSVGIIFKPVYGKIAFFSEKIIHFDFYMLVMGGAARVNLFKKSEVENENKQIQTNVISGLFSIAIGQNYFLTNNFAIGFELLDGFTFGKQAKDDTIVNQTISLRINMNYLF